MTYVRTDFHPKQVTQSDLTLACNISYSPILHNFAIR